MVDRLLEVLSAGAPLSLAGTCAQALREPDRRLACNVVTVESATRFLRFWDSGSAVLCCTHGYTLWYG